MDPSNGDDERNQRAASAVPDVTDSSSGPSSDRPAEGESTPRAHDASAVTTEMPALEDRTTAAAAGPAAGDTPGSGPGGGGTPPGAPLPPPGGAAGGPDGGPGTGEEPRPRHLRSRSPRLDILSRGDDEDGPQALRQKALLLAAAAPLLLVGLIVVVWAVDNAAHSGQVQRNVEVAGRAVGGASENSLTPLVGEIGEEVGERPVVIEIEGQEHTSNAADLGLSLDEPAVVDAAMEEGRDGSLFSRPFTWFGSLFSSRSVPLEYTVTETQMTSALQGMQTEADPERSAPVEPSIELQGGEFVAVPGEPGVDLDTSQARQDLLAEVGESHDPEETIYLETSTTEVEPAYSQQEAQDLADRANALTAEGITLVADGTERELSTEQLRNLLGVDITADDRALQFDTEAAAQQVAELYSDVSSEPQNATVTLSGGSPQVTPSENGVTCCGEAVGENIWTALNDGQDQLELEVEVVEPEHTTEEVEGWGIVEPVGGSRGWRSGQDVGGPKPGFTTWEVGSGGRAHNIRLMADQVNGAVIPPGGSFSINDHIGPRQCPPYQAGGAILNGEFVEECGGGVSQFATTMFNAAYFAGLNIPTYQAHSQYFDRYPRGREATMGHPWPDLVVENNTEYGVLIQATHSGDTVTVTMWSTQHIQAEQTGIDESPSGNCTVVTTTRTRTYPDGSTTNDSFSATYRPGEGEFC